TTPAAMTNAKINVRTTNFLIGLLPFSLRWFCLHTIRLDGQNAQSNLKLAPISNFLLVSLSKHLHTIPNFEVRKWLADNNCLVPDQSGGHEGIAGDFLLDNDRFQLNLFIDDNIHGLSRFALQDGPLWNNVKALILRRSLRCSGRLEESHSSIHVGADVF